MFPPLPKQPTFDVTATLASSASDVILSNFLKRSEPRPGTPLGITLYETLDSALSTLRDQYNAALTQMGDASFREDSCIISYESRRRLHDDALCLIGCINAYLTDTTTEYAKFALKVSSLIEEDLQRDRRRKGEPTPRFAKATMKMQRLPGLGPYHDTFRYELTLPPGVPVPKDPLHAILERLTTAVEQNTATLKLLADMAGTNQQAAEACLRTQPPQDLDYTDPRAADRHGSPSPSLTVGADRKRDAGDRGR